MAIRVITDSTADLPPDMAAELGIEVVPLNVHFGTDTFRDGIDLSADEFYQRLVASPRPPTTSQPSVGAFLEVYQKALDEGADGIVSVHISAKLSGTWNSSVQAREQLADPSQVEVVDTGQASMGLGWVAAAAARAAQASASLEEVANAARSAADKVRVLFLVDTLEFLQKGGRIGKAAAMFGSVLAIKPLLTIQEGEVHPLEKVRTRSKGVARLVQLVQEAAPLQSMAVLYTTTEDEARALAERLGPCVPGGEVVVGRLGTVVGTYAGPGLLGVGWAPQA